ncbi:hypothetical protein COMA1_10527 [Candidatus Nitrospira nitrosa]|uniref:Uncharacterized protein n=1 Tax=Candidatus Nitrospira nitrosa TaxID=1742972 RepID=A0A0S4L452_9BACT|nr:hypothetical protein [Candidatus Nitrospira nitrosa]CUS32245.1 hypothetical protein COMA1_10527 [Candidatus Nitrospira nitrosa]
MNLDKYPEHVRSELEAYYAKESPEAKKHRLEIEKVKADAVKSQRAWEAEKREFREKYGRSGMLERDDFCAPNNWTPYRPSYWTIKELKNRLKWLKDQRGTLLGKPEKVKELAENTRKIRKYTLELFRRYGAKRLARELKEKNRLRRYWRAMDKRKARKVLTDKWFEARKQKRLARKALEQQGPQETTKTSEAHGTSA